MGRRAQFTQEEVRRTVRGMIAAGLPVCGVRVDAGGITVLTEAPPPPAAMGEARNAADVVAARLGLQDGED